MSQFIDVHTGMAGMSVAELEAAHEQDLAVEAEEGVHFERTWLDAQAGKAFCLSTGPSKEAIVRAHERAGHPPVEIYEVASAGHG